MATMRMGMAIYVDVDESKFFSRSDSVGFTAR